mgnify:CR=1 FL=1
MKTIIKSYAYKVATAALIGVPALLSASYAHAVTSADQLFGGAASGDAFATSAGLGNANLTATIASIINTALSFLGIVAVVIILLGGFKWMTAGGNDDKVKEAKKLIFSGIIGLVIILSAYAIARFVIDELVGVTSGPVVAP